MYDYRPPITEPQIIHIDADLLVVDKPAGLLTVPGRRPKHKDCLLSRVQKQYPEAVIVHRLDMSTSGLLVLARNPDAHRELSRQFEQRKVEKTYLAVVNDRLEQTAGRIELPLLRDWQNRPKQRVDQTDGKPAITDFRFISYDPATNSSRVMLRPQTGRTHQLRVHMQALGHPILGDDLYADPPTLAKAERLMLHAAALSFTHPKSGEPLVFTANIPF